MFTRKELQKISAAAAEMLAKKEAPEYKPSKGFKRAMKKVITVAKSKTALTDPSDKQITVIKGKVESFITELGKELKELKKKKYNLSGNAVWIKNALVKINKNFKAAFKANNVGAIARILEKAESIEDQFNKIAKKQVTAAVKEMQGAKYKTPKAIAKLSDFFEGEYAELYEELYEQDTYSSPDKRKKKIETLKKKVLKNGTAILPLLEEEKENITKKHIKKYTKGLKDAKKLFKAKRYYSFAEEIVPLLWILEKVERTN